MSIWLHLKIKYLCGKLGIHKRPAWFKFYSHVWSTWHCERCGKEMI